MELGKFFGSVQQDLVKVEDMLRLVSNTHLSSMEKQLPYDLEDSNGNIAELLVYSLDGGGKRLRPALVLMSGSFYDYNLEHLLMMATAVEILHTASLVHDDIIDKTETRRGRPVINRMWDNEKATLLGDYLIAKAWEFVFNTQNMRVMRLFVQTILAMTGGELTQSFSAFNLTQSRSSYLNRIASKTASLFSLAAESGAILSQAPERSVKALKEYGHNFGMAYQIMDDIMDFVGTEEEMGKPVGSDLTQGTLTLPAMLLLERHPEDNPVRKVFQNKNKKENVRRAIELVRRDSSIVRECHAVALDYSAKGCRKLESLPHNASQQSLKDLIHYVVTPKTSSGAWDSSISYLASHK